MPAFAAFGLIAATVGAAQAGPAPSPLFAAFKAACFDVHKFDGVGAAATAAGWVEIAEAQADPRVTAIVAKGREAMRKEAPEAKVSGQMFRQRFDGRDVWLVTSRIETGPRSGKDGGWASGCRAYDLDATAAPSRETIDGWVGATPNTVQANGTASKRRWEPWQPGVSLEITYVPRGHPLGASYGIQGLIFVSQSIGGF
ncbi:hypothetical protein CA223_12080 [Sphingomonas koreensis]|jgi:hypothetical protein|uniref:Uncharacterized protein n=1 Tax=Sphingomonas koreensis TaxID=93064 RepID=A0A1L6J947_9SPHN|nr:hypothetical protein [Sphingomonas koreensis]APR52462.1 hypothetical protein BRX40_08470 [Sphingomonas koreensis]MDC7811630.1 hypothetical protein [Sphingomonas koreensis]RSU18855.1 hypothetical protein CA225_24165 [Sphingomonas koreensis]RSU19649.1 hypothetical protein CA224_11325 [Sphingomonas koreensis]RSU26437.1 hypothetical protein CA222_09040 [Sphingomonas koreensis]